MKRILSLILTSLFLLGLLAGCGGGETPPVETTFDTFAVGYGQADISTDLPLQLYGYAAGGERLSKKILDPIYATCAAFTDPEGTTVLMITIDLCQTFKVNDQVRKLISEATGIPVSNIMITASHTHSAPGQDGDADANIKAYNEMYRAQCLQAAKDALADRKPAKMELTFTRAQNMNFNRHYVMADGSYLGVGVGAYKQEELYGHMSAADNMLQMVKFTREGGKDIVLINWQGHYYGTKEVDYYAISADYPGVLRDEVNKALDCYSLFVLGPSGNVNTNSQIDVENKFANYIEYGQALAKIAVEAAGNFQAAETGKIVLVENNHQFEGGTTTVPLYAFGFGDFGCVLAPFEVFSSTGIAVKNASKFPYTFFATCANGNNKYLPDEKAFTYKSYEAESCTLYPKGTAEALQAQLSTMIDQVFTQLGGTEKPKAEGYVNQGFTPVSDGVEYMNPTPGNTAKFTPLENGHVRIALVNMSNMTPVDKIVLNEEVAAQVLQKDTVKLLFNDQNIVVGVVE